MFTRSRTPAALLAALVAVALAVPVRGGDTEDLHAAVRKWRDSDEATGGTLVGWTVDKASGAVAGVARQRNRPQAWSDAEVLAAALFLTARGRREFLIGGPSGLWFDLARRQLDAVADPGRRRVLQRDWTLALAAFINSRFDGSTSRNLLDRAVELMPDEPELLLATARLHEAIAARAYSGLAEPVSAGARDVVQPDLLSALRLYQRLIELAPDRAEARLHCARVLSLLRRGRDARELLEPLRQQAPTTDLPCLAWLFLGAVGEQEGHPAQALASYRGALATGRVPQTARLAIARLLRRSGDAAGARASVEEMLADDSAGEDDAWARYQAEGFGETNDQAARFAALLREARQ